MEYANFFIVRMRVHVIRIYLEIQKKKQVNVIFTAIHTELYAAYK